MLRLRQGVVYLADLWLTFDAVVIRDENRRQCAWTAPYCGHGISMMGLADKGSLLPMFRS